MADADSVEIDEGYAISEVTNRIGYILFGVYSVMSVIVFINILIAMMSSSFEHVIVSEVMIYYCIDCFVLTLLFSLPAHIYMD